MMNWRKRPSRICAKPICDARLSSGDFFILDQTSFLPTDVFVVQFKPKRDSSLRRPTRSPRKNLGGKQEANGKEKFGLLRSE